REIEATGNPIPRPACVLSGGETTVVVKGSGLGGRNQEFGLSLVKRAAELPDTVFLSAGTDGTDGPTDAAGALVDCSSLSRAKDLGIDPESYLRDNDSYHFFEKLGDLIITGPTRTNVMDVRIVLVGEGEVREPFRPSKDL
ncbi:MAG: MOFRL family protein, partial [Thermodesulfobacteriota bacterium]